MKIMTVTFALTLLFTAGANAVESIETHHNAIIAHETMNNAQAAAHQHMMQMHQKQIGEQPTASQHAVAFSEMNEHEQAAVVQESLNNGSAYTHQRLAAKHRQQIPVQ